MEDKFLIMRRTAVNFMILFQPLRGMQSVSFSKNRSLTQSCQLIRNVRELDYATNYSSCNLLLIIRFHYTVTYGPFL
jgi:hypothetical protein